MDYNFTDPEAKAEYPERDEEERVSAEHEALDEGWYESWTGTP